VTLKTLTKQHADFAARQERKAARTAKGDARRAAKAVRDRQWVLTKERQRKTRESRERDWDLAQQRRLEDAAAVYDGYFDDL
jgi:hypothetical protein